MWREREVWQKEMEGGRRGGRRKRECYPMSNLIWSSINHYNHPVHVNAQVFGSLRDEKNEQQVVQGEILIGSNFLT